MGYIILSEYNSNPSILVETLFVNAFYLTASVD